MSTTSSGKVFESELMDIYDAEQRIESALQEMADEVEREDLQRAFQEHREETRGQIDRLERVFEMAGIEAQGKECKAIQGLIDEHSEFTGENPEQAELDLFDVVAAQKVEHYEIATYGSLAKLADELGMDEAGDLLHENLEEEKETLEKLTQLTNDYDFQALPAAD